MDAGLVDQGIDLVKSLGVTKGLFVIFFFIAHIWVHLLHKGRLKDRQNEIDRLAQDNREYRERFLSLMDQKFSYSPQSGSRKSKKSRS